jgi:type 1 glutamine amidotransferase
MPTVKTQPLRNHSPERITVAGCVPDLKLALRESVLDDGRPENTLRGMIALMSRFSIGLSLLALLNFGPRACGAAGMITYDPGVGPGQGKHIAFVCGEWEYRCEESLPMLAKILAERHGFKCTVLFSMNPVDGTVDPSVKTNIPAMSVLQSADMMVVFAMDLELPDEQMKHFAEFLQTGKPVFGIRCSLLSFRYETNKKSPYASFDFRNPDGGYATALFGEGWKGHYGSHGKESTRGLRAGMNEADPILRGVYDVWGPTDVYRATKLPPDAKVFLYGQVLTGMKPDDLPNWQRSIMPMVWTREIKRDSGQVSRVVMSTIGAAPDMESEDLRRLYVNAIYWALGLGAKIPEKADVSYVGGDWKASPFGGGKYHHGLKPEDFAIKKQ